MYYIVNRRGAYLAFARIPCEWRETAAEAVGFKLHDEAKLTLEKIGPIARRIGGLKIIWEDK